MNEPLNI